MEYTERLYMRSDGDTRSVVKKYNTIKDGTNDGAGTKNVAFYGFHESG